jgi:hypothetical protein
MIEKVTEIIPLEDINNEQWLLDAIDKGQLWNVIMAKLNRYEKALFGIVDCHGTHDILRHECTKMANLARVALEKEE